MKQGAMNHGITLFPIVPQHESWWASQAVQVVKNLPASAGDAGGLVGSYCVRKIPWRSTWQPTPVLLPENPMDRGAWWATVHGVAKSWT